MKRKNTKKSKVLNITFPSQLELEVKELKEKLEESMRSVAYEQGRRREAQEQLVKLEENRKDMVFQIDRTRERWMEEIFFLRRFVMLLTVDKEKSEEVTKLLKDMEMRQY